jgi:hypothetical protein
MFLKKQSLELYLFAYFKTYYQRKIQKFSLSRFFVEVVA